MIFLANRLRVWCFASTNAWLCAVACCSGLAVVLSLAASGQQPGPTPLTNDQPTAAAPGAAAAGAPQPVQPSSVTEEELRQLLVGKALYLRGGYLDNSLNFDERGRLVGHSPQGSYTLSAVRVDKMRLTKHKVELTGARYGLHFLGQLAYEDSTSAVDRVKITAKKKVVKITIARELVITPKKKKEKVGKAKLTAGTPASAVPAVAAPAQTAEASEGDQLTAAVAAAPAPEGVTTSPAHAAKLLKDALDKIFAPGLDERMLAAMPDFWRLYYEAVRAKTDYRPTDPAVLRQNTVDKKAKLLSTFEPASNEYAQANAVAGMALYHTVIGADGKPGEIAVGRPIGFGLDENAVDSIRKASFEPAVKGGKAVPVLLDLVVQFRIYSKRTAVGNKSESGEKAVEVSLPGPYSLKSR